MLQKKEYQQRYQQYQQKLMLQNKRLPTTTIKKPIVENQTSGKIKTNVTKEGLPTTIPTKIPTIPTKTNVTKEGLPTTTTTIKKPIVENQTSGKIKTNVTKEGIPTTTN